MEHRYDEIYPLTKSDPVRRCRECGTAYQQWSRCQDNAAFSMCLRCAPVYGERRKSKRR